MSTDLFTDESEPAEPTGFTWIKPRENFTEGEETAYQIAMAHQDKMATDVHANSQIIVHEAANPLALLQDALERGTDPDKLGKLMDLAERWESRHAEKEYAAAMQACQEEMQPVARDKWNEQTKSHYLQLETLHRQLKPIWIKHGFTVSFGSDTSPMPDHYRCVATVRHVGGHTTIHFLDAPGDDKGMKGTPNKTPLQGVVSTMTTLRRNLECLIFDVTLAGFDADGNKDTTVINGEQELELLDLFDQFSGPDAEKAAFIRWLGVDKLTDVPAWRFNEAKGQVVAKLKKVNGAR